MIAFQSDATNLVSTPVMGGSIQDIYVRTLRSPPRCSSPRTSLRCRRRLQLLRAAGQRRRHSRRLLEPGQRPHVQRQRRHVLLEQERVRAGLAANTTQLVSINSSGTDIGNSTSDLPNQTFTNVAQQDSGVISSDGRYVIFISQATNLVPNFVSQQNDPTYGYDLYLRDTVAGTTTLLSHQTGSASVGGNDISGTAVMTSDGTYVAFESTADNLVAQDTNGGDNQTDVFVTPDDQSSSTSPTGSGTAPRPRLPRRRRHPPRRRSRRRPQGSQESVNQRRAWPRSRSASTSGSMPGSATKPALYSVLEGVKKHGKLVFKKALAIRTVTYNVSAHSVTINLAKPVKGTLQVTVHGGLVAASGASGSGSSGPFVT